MVREDFHRVVVEMMAEWLDVLLSSGAVATMRPVHTQVRVSDRSGYKI